MVYAASLAIMRALIRSLWMPLIKGLVVDFNWIIVL